ncbi:MAG TPA: ABC transporter permease [Gaiellaceae bacterium]|nr:ABC transporter permease [Gaiellaceae bacterium]
MIRRVGSDLVRSGAGLAGLALLLAVTGFVVLVPWLWEPGANAIDFSVAKQLPSAAHPLGTDFFGRDLLARLAVGGRESLAISGAALAIVLVVGFVYGAAAAMLPRRLDAALMRLVDSLLAVPRFPVIVIVLVVFGQTTNALTVVIALALGGWMIPARLVRLELVSLRQRPFVLAARSLGVGPLRLVRLHLFPNAVGVLLVAAFLELPTLVLGEAFASALGLGITPPTATWGNIAYDGMDEGRVWQVFLPSVAIALFAIAANLLADGIQEALGAGVGGRGRLGMALERALRALFGRPRRLSASAP